MTLGETREIVYAVLAEHDRCEVKEILLRRVAADREFRWAMTRHGKAIFRELINAQYSTVH